MEQSPEAAEVEVAEHPQVYRLATTAVVAVAVVLDILEERAAQ
jgi:hypothetical protein